MNPQIQKLHAIAQKDSRLIIGLMSGTSLDGLDVALCKISESGKQTKVQLLEFETHDYDENFKNQILEIFAKKEGDFQKLTLLNAYIGKYHGELVLKSLKKWNRQTAEIDAIASHGQTVFHYPKRLNKQLALEAKTTDKVPFLEGIGGTLQIGDGDHLAHATGIITISDFRQKHVAGGGEGAPLAVYGDCLLFSSLTENRILLNLGGIANFTFLPKSNSEKILVTDTGPGNTLIDAAMQKYFNQPFDKDGKVGESGEVIPEFLEALIAHPFYQEKIPKSTGQEQFNLAYVEKILRENYPPLEEVPDGRGWNFHSEQIPPPVSPSKGGQSLRSIITTLSYLTTQTIATQIKNLKTTATIYVSGGGAFNSLLIKLLKEQLPNFTFKKIDELGISAESKEAVLFAVLANQTLAGSPIKIADLPEVNFGKISFPL